MACPNLYDKPAASWLDLSRWHFDIDRYLLPSLPLLPWDKIPRPIARLLGYRRQEPAVVGNIIIALWSLLGVFCGVAIVAEVTVRVPLFQHHHMPVILGSFVC